MRRSTEDENPRSCQDSTLPPAPNAKLLPLPCMSGAGPSWRFGPSRFPALRKEALFRRTGGQSGAVGGDAFASSRCNDGCNRFVGSRARAEPLHPARHARIAGTYLPLCANGSAPTESRQRNTAMVNGRETAECPPRHHIPATHSSHAIVRRGWHVVGRRSCDGRHTTNSPPTPTHHHLSFTFGGNAGRVRWWGGGAGPVKVPMPGPTGIPRG
jgi:hypothetical protein